MDAFLQKLKRVVRIVLCAQDISESDSKISESDWKKASPYRLPLLNHRNLLSSSEGKAAPCLFIEL